MAKDKTKARRAWLARLSVMELADLAAEWHMLVDVYTQAHGEAPEAGKLADLVVLTATAIYGGDAWEAARNELEG